MRDALRAGASAAALLTVMLGGSLVLWIGLPVAWLWIGSQVEGATSSIGAGVGAAMVGFLLSVIVAVPALGWLCDRRCELQVARGREDPGHFALEVVMVLSAGLAVVAFGIWFFVFSGAEVVPFV